MLYRSTRSRLVAAALVMVCGVVVWTHTRISGLSGRTHAQEATSVQLTFPTATPTLGPPTETPTRTPTPQGSAQIEALTDNTNIRSGPDINESRIGQIFPGTKYDVLGRRFDWFWIKVPEVPGGTAWVYFSVVNLTGDEATIPQLELEDLPTADPGVVSGQQTALAISATPGAAATLTAEAFITPTGVFTAAASDNANGQESSDMAPTFTHPASTVTPVPFPRTNPPPETSGLAPIVPILALGALGLMGLLVAIMRRL